MLKRTIILVFIISICFTTSVFGDVNSFGKSVLADYGKNPTIVNAVKKQNAKNMKLADIQDTDKKWIQTVGVDEFMSSIMNNECANYLKTVQSRYGFILEIFVMDNKGANVAMTDKTSDYWQGDEDKFIKTYNKGNGSIHFSDEEFDESTQTYLIQVSVPVMSNGKAIGAITFGIDLGSFDQ